MTASGYVSDPRDYNPNTDKPIKGSLRQLVDSGMPSVQIPSGTPPIHLGLGFPIVLYGDKQIIKGPGTVTGHQIVLVGDGAGVSNLRIRSGEGYASEAEKRKVHGEYDNPASPTFGGVRSLVAVRGIGQFATNCDIQLSTDDNLSVWDGANGFRAARCIISGDWLSNPASITKGALIGDNVGGLRISNAATLYRCVFIANMGRTPDFNIGHIEVNECLIFRHRWQGSRIKGIASYTNNFFFEPTPAEMGMGSPDKPVCVDGCGPQSLYFINNKLNGVTTSGGDLCGYANKYNAPLIANEIRTTPFPWTSAPVTAPSPWQIWKDAGVNPRDAVTSEVMSRAAEIMSKWVLAK